MDSKNNNMTLWRLVEKTDPSIIVDANVGGQKRKTVKAHHQKERATEVFGVYGSSWGVEPESEKYERVYYDNGECLLQYTAIAFYNWDGKSGRFPIAAAIFECNIVKRGKPDEYMKRDNEAIKKVRTDALTKGLSELGFNADIFKGWHDQSGYSEYAANEIADDREADRVVALAARTDELIGIVKDYCLAYKANTIPHSIKLQVDAHKASVRKFAKEHGIDSTPYIAKLEKEAAERREELKQQKDSQK